MATNTTNYNLEKPSEDEFYDVGVQNDNMDKIDAAIKGVDTKAENLGTSKVDKVTGKGLSTEDFTTAEKTKLQNIAANAQVNVLEGITVNGVAVTVDSNKKSNIPVPAATTVVNSLTSTSTTSALSAAQGKALKDLADGHIESNINTEDGVHGIRYYDEVLSFWNGTEWVEIETGGGGGVYPGNVTGISISPGGGQLEIKWTDPDDEYWYGTKVVMKAGSYPDDEGDGTVIVDSRVRNAYQSNAFTKSGLTNGTEYFFGFFPYSEAGAVNYNPENKGSGTPVAYSVWGVEIDLSNSNPSSCITYTDDAVGMTAGSDIWDTVFGIKPCLFLNGAVVGYLNPDDFTKFEDGSSADITSGSAGDVMIEFPRMGLNITTVGNTVSVKLTDAQDHEDFEYYAHTRGSVRKDKFYLGAYKGLTLSSRLRSLSGKTITVSQTIGTFRTQAQANGTGYEQSGFYQLMYRQALYLLKYRNLDSQTALGRGYVDSNTGEIATGGTNAKGMTFGESTGKLQMKLFGIEDFWGNIREWIDGVFSSTDRSIMTATDGFNDAATGYTNHGIGTTLNSGGYMSAIQGTSEAGFIPKAFSGSETTYYCDYAYWYASCVACFGGYWDSASNAGAFRLYVSYSASYSSSSIAARLMYL